MRHMWFDRQGRPISMQEAERLLANPGYAVLAQHRERGYLVSTVWLALNRNFGREGPPLLFETMIYRTGDGDEIGTPDADYLERYPTEAAALAGHDQAVMHLRQEILHA